MITSLTALPKKAKESEIPEIRNKDKLIQLHDDFTAIQRKVIFTALPGAAAILCALLIIACPAFTLSFSQINVVTDYIFRFLIPGLATSTLSIPCIYLCIIYVKEQNRIREKTLNKIVKSLKEYKVADVEYQRIQVLFIKKNYVGEKHWHVNYSSALITGVVKKFRPKKELDMSKLEDKKEKKLIEALEKTKQKIFETLQDD